MKGAGAVPLRLRTEGVARSSRWEAGRRTRSGAGQSTRPMAGRNTRLTAAGRNTRSGEGQILKPAPRQCRLRRLGNLTEHFLRKGR